MAFALAQSGSTAYSSRTTGQSEMERAVNEFWMHFPNARLA